MKKVFSLMLALVLVLSLTACGGGDKPAQTGAAGGDSTAAGGETAEKDGAESQGQAGTPKKGGSINVGLNSAPISPNVWCQNDLNSATIMELVCPHLVAMDENGTKYDYLNEPVQVNEDCTVWTITMKEGLSWNDGTPVSAEDLLFTAEYGTSHHIGFFDSYFALVDFEASKVVDERTVEFHLTSGNVNFWNGAGYWIPVMRKSEWESVEDPTTHDYSGAGYGPYYISEWVDGEYVVLSRNPHFTLANDGEGALLDEIVFRVYTDENAMILALQNGEVDVCANFLSASSVTQLQNNPEYLIESVPSLGYAFISFSQTNELLTDVKVRQAIAMSVNRDALVNVAFAGAATAMETPISPVYTEFTKANITQPAYDTAAAGALLEEAGYKDTNGDGIRETADGTKLSFTIMYKSTLANVDGVMSILQAGTKEAGIELVLQPVDAATFSANVTQGHKYDISYSSWGTIDDVDTTLLTCFGIGQTLNFMEFNSQEQEDLLLAMQGETDYEKRVEMLDQWQTWFVENLPTCHLLVPNNTYVANTANYEGWAICPGNYGFMDCPNFVNVYKK